jgi:hypothetical protein
MVTRRRLCVAAAAVVAALALAVSAALQEGVGATLPTEIDLTGPVEPTSCTPCHAQLDRPRDGDPAFTHDTHGEVACSSCHVRPAHEGAVTHTPPMETCFACHGLTHGGDVLASAACETCHADVDALRPADHVLRWAEKPHAGAAEKRGTNTCVMCHDARAECDSCHREKGVDAPGVPPAYLPMVPVAEARPPLVISTEGSPTIGQCVFCHPDIDKDRENELNFAHDIHIARDYRCAVCHETFPHSPDSIERPDMPSCYRCHGAQHSAEGEVAPQECRACHPAGFELVPADHTARFIESRHREAGTEDLLACMTCHVSSSCAECHRSEKRLPDGSYSEEVIPDDHETDEWMAEHGEPFLLSGEATCSICHTNESCSRCHMTVMPHPTTWLASHTVSGYRQDDCRVCHSDRTWCQECHHDPDRSQELSAENCVNCHPVMGDTPFSEIKVVKLAEHAAHFEVEEHVGRPHRCDDCHVKLTAARVQHSGRSSAEIGGHDIRICYDCHGARDSDNVLLAPWPGADLCHRCHTEPNMNL